MLPGDRSSADTAERSLQLVATRVIRLTESVIPLKLCLSSAQARAGHRIQYVGLGAVHLTKTEPDANLHRFYRMDIVRGLFGDWGLVRNWGRLGSSGQSRTDWFDTESKAKGARFDLQMRKAKRGYE